MSQDANSRPRPDWVTLAEKIFFGLICAAILWLRLQYIRSYRFDSDEAQHLHVVWGWTRGLLQYRDVFDNHAPLFHILCAPLLRLFGERADILVWMRIAMLPLYAGCLWCIYKMGACLYSRRTGLWAALIAGLMPRFFLTAAEFRTDDLWALLWLVAVTILVTRPFDAKSIFLASFVLGTNFAVSMKTTLLLAALLFAGIFVAGLIQWTEPTRGDRRTLLRGLAASTALLIVPSLLVVFFWAKGALGVFFYCVIQHNVVPDLKRWASLKSNVLQFGILLVPVLVVAGHFFRKGRGDTGTRARRTLIFLLPLVFIVLLYAVWPDITREDALPYCPLLALIIAPPLIFASEWIARRSGFRILANLLPLLACGIEVVLLVTTERPNPHRGPRGVATISEVLQLTRPGEYVMDNKSGGIYRERPFYYVLETITRHRIALGLIQDTIAERLVATGTAVVATGSFTAYKSNAFVVQNYIRLAQGHGELSVLGKILHTPASAPLEVVKFNVAIPAEYVVVQEDPRSRGMLVKGTVDGTILDGPRLLETGDHELRCAPITGRVALFWARAWEKGFSPFSGPND